MTEGVGGMTVGGKVLVIYRAGGEWVARTEGPEAARVVALFGTDTLPTPFRASTDVFTVSANLKRLNPGAQVIWDQAADRVG